MKRERRNILELAVLLEFLGGHLKRASERAVTRQLSRRRRALFESAV